MYTNILAFVLSEKLNLKAVTLWFSYSKMVLVTQIFQFESEAGILLELRSVKPSLHKCVVS